MYYNFCSNTITQCNNMQSTFISKDLNGCKRLAGPAESNNVWQLINETNPEEGVLLTLPSGDQCSSSANYTLTWKLLCDENAESLNIKNKDLFNTISCSSTITATTKAACPKLNLYSVWKFIEKTKYITASILIVIGILLTFFGKKLFTVTVFIISIFSCLILTFMFFFSVIMPAGGSTVWVWVSLGIGIILGILLGWFLTKYDKFFHGVLGGVFGYLLAIMLFNLFLNRLNLNPTFVFYFTIVLCVLICAIVSYYIMSVALIIATSFIGGYGIIRGISILAGGFPNESYVMDLIKNKEYEELKKVLTVAFYIYLAGWLVLTICGMIVQFRLNRGSNDPRNLVANDPNKSINQELHMQNLSTDKTRAYI